MMKDYVSVLDLGTTKAACVVAEHDASGGLRILGAAEAECKGVRRGTVTDLEEAARAVDGACRRAQQEAGRDVNDVVVALGGGHVETHEARGYVPIYPRTRPISRDDVMQVVNHSRQLVMPPDREQILALPREFRVDGQNGIQRPIGMVGGRLEVCTFLATAETAQIHNLERALSMTGRSASMVVPLALASGLGVLTPQELEVGAAVVDIGGGGTQVGLFSGGSVTYAAFVPIGASHVTSDLMKLLKVSPEEAERLKRLGSAVAADVSPGEPVQVMQIGQTTARPLDRRVLSEIIESRIREIATMVKQQLERSGHFGTLPGGVIITGGGSLLPATSRLFEKVFEHMKARCASPAASGPGAKLASTPGFSAAVGLARFALDSEDDELCIAGTNGKWTEKVRTLWSMLSGRA